MLLVGDNHLNNARPLVPTIQGCLANHDLPVRVEMSLLNEKATGVTPPQQVQAAAAPQVQAHPAAPIMDALVRRNSIGGGVAPHQEPILQAYRPKSALIILTSCAVKLFAYVL